MNGSTDVGSYFFPDWISGGNNTLRDITGTINFGHLINPSCIKNRIITVTAKSDDGKRGVYIGKYNKKIRQIDTNNGCLTLKKKSSDNIEIASAASSSYTNYSATVPNDSNYYYAIGMEQSSSYSTYIRKIVIS